MSNKSFSMSISQFVFLIYKTQIGIGLLTLPRDLFTADGYDSWIAIIFGWAVTVVISFIMIRTMEKHPNDSLFDLLPKLFGKWLGKAMIFCWVVFALFTGSFAFIYTVHLMKVWILPSTNPMLTAMLFIIPIYQITKNGLPMISRFAEFTFLATIWMYPIILMSMGEGIWLNLSPIASEGWMPILQSTPVTLFAFLGFEQAFILYPHLQNKKKAFKAMVITNSMTAGVLLMVTIISFIRFSEHELLYTIWPTLELLKLVSFPFLERLEIIFMSAYLIIIFMTVIPYLHMTLVGASKLVHRSVQKPMLILILIAWVVMFYFPIFTSTNIIMLKTKLIDIVLIFVYIFPIVLWLYNKVFLALRKGQQIR